MDVVPKNMSLIKIISEGIWRIISEGIGRIISEGIGRIISEGIVKKLESTDLNIWILLIYHDYLNFFFSALSLYIYLYDVVLLYGKKHKTNIEIEKISSFIQ